MAVHLHTEAPRVPLTTRLSRHPAFRALFMGPAMVAAVLGAPLRVEPPRPGRVPVEVVRGEGDDEPDPGTAEPVG